MSLSYHDLVRRALQEVPEIDVSALAGRLDEDPPLVIDVREPVEFATGAIAGSKLVPRGVIEGAMGRIAADRDREIVLVCAAGNRSALAARDLKQMGYRRVWSLAGGMAAWRRAGLPTTAEEGAAGGLARYARHLSLPGVGEQGQRRLRQARIAVVGAGGLGSPAALYLAAAGVGTIGVVDDDVVDISNLQRQVLHDETRLGVPKVDSAADTISRLNSEVSVERHSARLTAETVLDVLEGYEVVVDGSDNFPTRYLLNDAALHLRVPVVHGAVFRWEGQATVFSPYEGPCYRCLFPEPPPPEMAPDCEVAGVLGALPGIIGSLQAVETLKLLLGVGDPLIGRMLTYGALTQEFHDLRFDRDPSCAACGDEEHPPALVEYDARCLPGGTGPRS